MPSKVLLSAKKWIVHFEGQKTIKGFAVGEEKFRFFFHSPDKQTNKQTNKEQQRRACCDIYLPGLLMLTADTSAKSLWLK